MQAHEYVARLETPVAASAAIGRFVPSAKAPPVAPLKRRDPEAWRALFEAEYDRLFRFLAGLVGDVHAAEDLAAQVFLEAVDGIDRFQDRGRPPAAWLMTIARRRAIDWMRRARTRARLEDALLREEPANVPGFSVAPLLASLKADQAKVLHLRYIEGYPVREIARLLGRSEGAIRQLEHRGLARLRSRFAAAGGEDGP